MTDFSYFVSNCICELKNKFRKTTKTKSEVKYNVTEEHLIQFKITTFM